MERVNKGRRSRRVAVCCAALAVVGALGAGAVAANLAGANEAGQAQRMPEVRVLEDGTLIQRTPNMPAHGNPNGVNWTNYNVDFLAGDLRGCGSCHADLNDVVANIAAYSGYNHIEVGTGVDTELTVQQCRLCHYEGNSHDSLGQIIHAIHTVDMDRDGVTYATCFNCHSSISPSVTNEASDQPMPLWDDVKHKEFRGITAVPEVQGTFAFDQDTLSNEPQRASLWWLDDAEIRYDDINYVNARTGVPIDDELFETWEISVTGEVDEEMTFRLADLVNNPDAVETRVMKMNCAMNPMGGALITNSEVKGISVKWLLEQAGLADTANSFNFLQPDGDGMGMYISYSMDELDSKDPLLVFEINGERLSWEDGYPLQAWVGAWSGNGFIKEVCEVRVSDRVVADKPEGERNPAGRGVAKGMSKPNVGVFGVKEGQCIQAGQPFTFEGYADAYENPITAVEFSMDGGATWTTYETPGTDAMRWVHWTWTWDVPATADTAAAPSATILRSNADSAAVEDSGSTAYVLMVRAVTEADGPSPEPLEIMVNAKTDLESFAAAVAGE